MGFDLFLKTDLATGERAVQALAEFGKLATEQGDYDWTGLSCVLLWRPEQNFGPWEGVVEGLEGYENVAVWGQALTIPDPDYRWPWDPSLYPGPGECVLAWNEIAWSRFVPPEALQALHDLLGVHDGLAVWADILAAQDRIGSFTDAAMGKLAQIKGGEFIKGGRSG
jgi:hypothetical protein